MKDVSSSEKPKFGGKMCETILEESILQEREDLHMHEDEDCDDEGISHSSFADDHP